MTLRNQSLRPPDIGRAARLLTIAALAPALLVACFSRHSSNDESARRADVAPKLMRVLHEPDVAPAAVRALGAQPAATVPDTAIVAHEELDPVGAGRRYASP